MVATVVLTCSQVRRQQPTEKATTITKKTPDSNVDTDGIDTSKGERLVTDVDPDVSHWQIKETEFFSIKFPKEWYWFKASPRPGFSPDSVITNNPNSLPQYPDIGVSIISNDTEVVLAYSQILGSDNGAPIDNIISLGVDEDAISAAGCEILSGAQTLPIIKACVQRTENGQVERVYQVIYKNITVFLNARTTDDTLVSADIFEEIARNIVLPNGQ